MPRFSDDEIRRYGQQMVLPVVGGVGQERLRAATVTTHGELEALYLAGAGVGHLVVPADDIADAVRALNPLVGCTVVPSTVTTDPRAQTEAALSSLRRLLEL